jgi:hypothetical protein
LIIQALDLTKEKVFAQEPFEFGYHLEILTMFLREAISVRSNDNRAWQPYSLGPEVELG